MVAPQHNTGTVLPRRNTYGAGKSLVP